MCLVIVPKTNSETEATKIFEQKQRYLKKDLVSQGEYIHLRVNNNIISILSIVWFSLLSQVYP